MPTIAEREQLLRLAKARKLKRSASDQAPLEPADRSAPLALSFAQRRLWFLEQLGGAGTAYHIPTGLRLRGELDRDALVRALDRIVARHEVLRTTFVQADGEPEQRIAPESRFPLLDHDPAGHPQPEAELRRVMREEAAAPFDLARGPLIRGRLVRLAADDHVLLVTMHHIVSDGWSMGVLTRELSALYAAFTRGDPDPLSPLAVQYADYAAWQRRWVEGEVLQRQAEYWRTTLAGAPELLQLPADRPRPARQDHAGAAIRIELGEELTAGLKALGERHETTLFMTLLAGWSAVLGRLSGQEDVVIGTPAANRGRAEIEGLIGLFVNTLALRVDLSGAPSVAELLARVKETALAAQQHPDIPFEQVVEVVQPARSLAHTPLFQVMLAWQNVPAGELELPGLRLSPARPSEQVTAKLDLTLSLAEVDGRIAGAVEYATALFDRETVERWTGYLRRALEAMAAEDGAAVERLPLLGGDERRRVLETWNATDAAYPAGACIHELFEAQAGRTPGAAAVVFAGESLSYAALNARANRLAHHLRGLGVGPEVRVAICVERGPEMMVTLLAVLKAGGAYLPLDPDHPAGRLRQVLDDAAPALLLSQAPLAGRFAGVEIPRVWVDQDAGAWACRPETNPRVPGLGPDSLAYVIYTSGSTGRPKGVMNLHGGAANLLWSMRSTLGMAPADRLLAVTTLSFDIAALELFLPLLCGARVEILPRTAGADPALLQAAIAGGAGTVLQATPTSWRLLVDHGWRGAGELRALCGGEALPGDLAARVRERVARLWNVYGPTETTIWSSSHPVGTAGEGRGPVAIGRPVANTRIYVLDRAGEPVPVGAAGEVHIGGAGVARGYLGRAALTAERFVPDPFGGRAGARMYRTGDVGRWRRDGTLEYVGRDDVQVKVRGYRIEPGEIEARLAELPGVREAVVVAREDAPGDRRLVAYVVGDEVDAGALRAGLLERLPEYMVPAAYVRLAALPLTPNGKVSRGALPAPGAGVYATRAYQAPAGETEAALSAIWAELLKVERVGRRDHFFDLGGHSLLAVQVVSRVRQALGVEMALGDLFVHPVLEDLARALAGAGRAELSAIEPVERGGPLPLSFAQQRLWFLEQLGSGGAAYHVPARLRLRGALDRDALGRALDRIVARHEALRTTFAAVDGRPGQRIAPAAESRFHLLDHDLAGHPAAEAELRRQVAEEAGAPFDLERGPLVRGRLLRVGHDEHVLLVTMHHIVSDGWSIPVLVREVSALYGAFVRGEADPLPPLPLQYADYASWQRSRADAPAQLDYWSRTLAGAPELLELPTDHPRPARRGHAGGSVAVHLDPALAAGVKALGRREGTTPFMTVLAGWAVVLGRLAGQDDVVIGTPTANRGRRETEGLIGFFVNTLALRVDLSGGPTVAELLARVKARALDAQHNQDVPFEQVVEAVRPGRSLAHTPLFQVLFAWQNTPRERLDLPGLEVAAVPAPAEGTAKFDLSLSLHEAGGCITGGLTYATALLEPATAGRYAGYLRRVLEAMVAGPEARAGDLALMPEPERRQVLRAWNATAAEYPDDACIHELFEAQARRTPAAVAVVHEGGRLTYAELNAGANRLAHHLRERGVAPDVRVALCLERSPEMLVGVLAVLKAGGAYVPLEPEHPAERLRHVLDDSAPALLLTHSPLAGRFAGMDIPRVSVDGDSHAWAQRPETNPRVPGLGPDSLAYVIYTSGSTGSPKGVMNPHRGLVNRLTAGQRAWRLEPGEAVLQKTSLGFDGSVREIFWPLMVGARVVLARPGGHRDPAYLLETIREDGVTTVNLVPSMLQVLVEAPGLAGCTGLRRVLCGGEALPAALLAQFRARLPRVALHNLYGPSEAATAVVAVRCTAAEARATVPIGRPNANTRAYVLDASGMPVPPGVAGELYIGGAGVARGYQGRPALTAERFVPDRFGAEPGGRLYRTGDLARWLPDGQLEFLGRNDFQVKVRGFRVEPGEVEARLLEHGAVREAVVVAREDASGDRRLVAYCAGDGIDAESLRAHLSGRLPEYMVPAAYVRLDALPLTPNGKV
ncbi:MAG TPA: amino acid adenylation domain-containing protein, partial [Longimicrobium sp.]|nr:amino acid adenylation domain-containing protein [Longimicrobium sp.]